MSNPRGGDTAAENSTGVRDEVRLLALLESDETGGLTIAALRELGVTAPGQAIYALQLAGHSIERTYRQDSEGNPKQAYRLRASQ